MFHSRNSRGSVHKLTELFPPFWVADDGGPLIRVRTNKFLHFTFEVSANTQFVVQEDLLQFLDSISLRLMNSVKPVDSSYLDPAFKRLHPSSSASQFIRCADIKHKISVNDPNHLGWRDVGRKKSSMAWLRTTISSDEDYHKSQECMVR